MDLWLLMRDISTPVDAWCSWNAGDDVCSLANILGMLWLMCVMVLPLLIHARRPGMCNWSSAKRPKFVRAESIAGVAEGAVPKGNTPWERVISVCNFNSEALSKVCNPPQ